MLYDALMQAELRINETKASDAGPYRWQYIFMLFFLSPMFCFGSTFQSYFPDVGLTSGKLQHETIRSSLLLQKNQMCGFLTHLDARYLQSKFYGTEL